MKNAEERKAYLTEYYQRNKEARDAYKKRYYEDPQHQQHLREYKKLYYQQNIERIRQYRLMTADRYKQYRLDNRGKLTAYGKWYRGEEKRVVISFYSNNTMGCVGCGFSDIRALTIDHMDGGGNKHRRQTGFRFYRWLKINNFPAGYQVLCMNCQFIKRVENKECGG